MDANQLPPLTPEQRQAILAGDGAAYFVDPETNAVYMVTPKAADHPCELPDEATVRRQLEEVRLDFERHGGSELSITEVIEEARRHRASGAGA